MANACPLNFQRVDANLARLNSLFVAFGIVVYLYSDAFWVLLLLASDFIMRLFFKAEYAPLRFLAFKVKNLLHIEEKFCDGGAKRLAAYFGLFFVFLLIGADLLGYRLFGLGVGIVFLSCALLDVFFDYCLGCKIYYIIKKIYPNFMSNL